MSQQILCGGQSFSPVILREAEYEAVVSSQLPLVFSDWKLLDWKPLIGGNVRPDALLVRSDYSEWAVVEFELAHHGASHFDSQFERLASASYGIELHESIVKADASCDPALWERLLRRASPTMLCIANELTDSIKQACEENLFELAVVQPFRSTQGNYLLSISRTPRMFRPRPAPHSPAYQLERSGRLFGSRELVYVPSAFPVVVNMHLRCNASVSPVEVKRMADGRRFLLLPGNIAVAKSHSLRLRSVDPSVGLFELEQF